MSIRKSLVGVVRILRVPQAIPILGFAAVILVGSALLWMPFAHEPGAVSYLDALFTSTSAVCVTGLVVVDTSSDYTVAGQVIIMLLIQIGGLGVMTYAAMTLSLLHRRMSLRSQAVLQESLFQRDEARDFRRRLRQILLVTFSVEAAGALLLFISRIPDTSVGAAAWSGVFHAVSAFCNAGFSIFPQNLAGPEANHFFLAVVMLLIIAGGLGFMVLHEILGETGRSLRGRPRERARIFSLHTALVLWVTLILIVGGMLALLFFGLTPTEDDWGSRIEGALFQSVTARTAGFNSIDIAALPVASLLALVLLMFIGGSPASCAGGVKTTTVGTMFALVRGYLRGEEEVKLLGRKLSRQTIRAAGVLVIVALVWNLVGVFLLAHLEQGRPGMALENLIFEQISAFGTVGLSANVTPMLSVTSRLWIIATMFVGRLGPLTLASLAMYRKRARVGFPEGKVMIG